MSEDDNSAIIIELRPGQDATDDDRLLASGEREPYCSHKRVTLHTESRRCTCRACGREVPIFDVLDKLCTDMERYITARKEAERRCRVAQGNLEDLLRVERNAKARRRNWMKSEPEAMRHLRAVIELLQLLRPTHPVTIAAAEFVAVAGEEDLAPDRMLS